MNQIQEITKDDLVYIYSQVGTNSRMSQDRVKFEHPVFLSMGESHVK